MLNSPTNTLDVPLINIFYRWPNLLYTKDYQSLSPNSPTLVLHSLFPRDSDCPVIPMNRQKTEIQVLNYILTSSSSTRSPSKNLPHPLPLLMLPPANSLSIPTDQSSHPSNSPITSFSSPVIMDTGAPSYWLMNVENFSYHQTPM